MIASVVSKKLAVGLRVGGYAYAGPQLLLHGLSRLALFLELLHFFFSHAAPGEWIEQLQLWLPTMTWTICSQPTVAVVWAPVIILVTGSTNIDPCLANLPPLLLPFQLKPPPLLLLPLRLLPTIAARPWVQTLHWLVSTRSLATTTSIPRPG